MILRIFTSVFFFCICFPLLLAQVSLPKYYTDYEICENVDSLERYVYAHQENQLAYMHGLISLEMSRGVYKDIYGQDANTIKHIAMEQNDELGKIMALLQETPGYFSMKNKVNVLENLYRADAYFTKTKDTLGVLIVGSRILTWLKGNTSFSTVGSQRSYESWFQKVIAWGETASDPRVKLLFYRQHISSKNVIISNEQEFNEILTKTALALNSIKKPYRKYYGFLVYSTLSSVFAKQGSNEKVLKYARLTYQAAKNFGYEHKGTALYNLAIAYKDLKQYEEAEKHFLAFYAMYKKQKQDYIEDEIAVLYDLSEIQYTQKRFKLAYDNKTIADSLQNLRNEKIKSDHILELETKYEVEKKDIQNAFLTQEKKGLESRNALLFIGIIMTSILSLFLIRISLDLKRANTKLNHAQQEIEKNSRFKQQLFHIIAHDLRSPIIAYSELTKTCAFLIKKNRLAELDTMGNKLDNIGFRLITLIDNLSLWSMSGKSAKEVKMINLQALFNTILPIYKEIALSKSINLALNLQENSAVQCDEQALLLIIRNFLDNAIKNSLNGETININVLEDAETVQLHFINKPAVINPSIITNIKELFASDIQIEIDKSGLGLGLILVKEFATANNATVTVVENTDGTLCFQVKFQKN